MDGIFDDVLQQVTRGDGLDALARRIGAPPEATADAAQAALPALFSALSRNASSPDGAASLLGALDRDHDGSVLDDLVGALSGGADSGGGLLGHVLGGRRGPLESELESATSLDPDQIGRLLAALAPLVMAALGRAQREHRMGSQELGYELGRVAKHAEESLGDRYGILGSLVDGDGDGRVDAGLIEAGKSLLGRLLRR